MLDRKDKEWILGAVTGIVDQRLEKGLEKGFEAQKVWFAKELKIQLKTELDQGLNKLRVELTDVMRDGFSECASARQVAELSGGVGQLTGSMEQLTGYVEEVREMVAGGFAESASAKQLDDLLDVVGDGFSECASAKQMEQVESRLGRVEITTKYTAETSLTKAYFDQRTDKEVIIHKQQSTKFTALVEVLRTEKVLSTRRANVVLAMEPHPTKLKE